MKNVVDRVWQLIVLILAIAFTLYLDLATKAQEIIPETHKGYFDNRNVVPIVSGLVYLGLLIVLAICTRMPIIRGAFDKNYAFRGRYLSLPANPDKLDILRIRTYFLGSKYHLSGYAYSLSKLRETGNWQSDSLDMSPTGRLAYIYSGASRDPNTGSSFDGRGYATIYLPGQKRENGYGYWIDIPPGANVPLVREDSNYVKLTPAIKKMMMSGQSMLWRLLWWFPWTDKSVVKVFASLSAEQRKAFGRAEAGRRGATET
jgi:hypothetical protein